MSNIRDLAEDLDKLTGSEVKAIIAIYSEGRYISSTEMMHITGMSRKTCLRVMESKHVKTAVARSKDFKAPKVDKIVQQLREELKLMEDGNAE